ncbi:hypothetical protein GUJ93_ZPchr0003g17810 [Zizania palustris]|uniref:Uncharacterized protein n=1 Tax=Zizania palustris TaxID=103762 RepID=A0A8J5RRW5_ZIZPA|nr:hypothetical protein GUJ93_ZPchr0003g17810 [Zizania palustris]
MHGKIAIELGFIAEICGRGGPLPSTVSPEFGASVEESKMGDGTDEKTTVDSSVGTLCEIFSDVPMVDVQALEEFASKLKLSEGHASSQGSSKASSGFHVTTQGATDSETSWDWDCA